MLERFRDMLWKRMRELGLTYEDLARRVGVSGVYVSRIVQGKVVPSDDVVYRLSRSLELDLERLVLAAHYEKAPEEVKPLFERMARHAPREFLGEVESCDNIELGGLGPGRPLPVVGLVRAGEFMASEDGEFPAGVSDQVVYSDIRGDNLFAVRVINDSMEPEFKEGDLLVVNPNLEARNGDYVIAKLREENEATFKKLVLHGRSGKGERSALIILRPLNPRYHDIVIEDPAQVEIVGRVVERKTLF